MLFDPRTPSQKSFQTPVRYPPSTSPFIVGDVVRERGHGRTGVVAHAAWNRIEVKLDEGGTRGCNARHFELMPADHDDSYR
jgi:hypothetical protein